MSLREYYQLLLRYLVPLPLLQGVLLIASLIAYAQDRGSVQKDLAMHTAPTPTKDGCRIWGFDAAHPPQTLETSCSAEQLQHWFNKSETMPSYCSLESKKHNTLALNGKYYACAPIWKEVVPRPSR